MKKVFGIGMALVLFLILPTQITQITGGGCGVGTFEIINKSDCDAADPENGCSVQGQIAYTYCVSNGTQCVGYYYWTACVVQDLEGNKSCKWVHNSVYLPCDNYVQPTDKPGGCVPPPAPKDLTVEWPYGEKVKATWKPGTPRTFAVADII